MSERVAALLAHIDAVTAERDRLTAQVSELRAALLKAGDEVESLYTHHRDLRPLGNFVVKLINRVLADTAP